MIAAATVSTFRDVRRKTGQSGRGRRGEEERCERKKTDLELISEETSWRDFKLDAIVRTTDAISSWRVKVHRCRNQYRLCVLN